MSVVPVFLLSLPRSGSTLLQRILAAHSEVSSASEPWLLLPLLGALRRQGVRADYNHERLVDAVEDFCNALPGGTEDYRKAVRHFATELYSKAASPSARFFIDKTPRYHLVASELVRTFPEAYFIVLWRNPLDVAASIMETWGGGRWNLHRYEIDLYQGLWNLIRVTKDHPDRVLHIRYEELVTETKTTLRRILEYLSLEWDDDMLSRFADVPLQGRFGAHLRSCDGSVRADSVNRWPATFANLLRRRWCRRYLERIGAQNLEWMGYDFALLEVRSRSMSPARWHLLFSDILRRTYAAGRALASRGLEHGEGIWRQSASLRRRL